MAVAPHANDDDDDRASVASSRLTIVAVHGNGGGGERFASMAPTMPADVRLEAVDLPGFGGQPKDPHLTSVAAYADQLAATVTAIDGPVILLGHGIGGSIALDLVSRRPQLVDGLILHAPVGASLDTRLFPRIMATAPVREVVRRAISSRILRPAWRLVFFPNGAPREVLDSFFEGYRQCEAFGDMFELIDADWFDALAPVVRPPAVLLWGEHDRVLDAAQVEVMQAKLPNARVVVHPGWGHFPMIEQPDEYVGVVVELADALVAATG